MISMSLDISLSGLLTYVLAYFTESVVSVLCKLIDQGRASNIFETQSSNSSKLLQEILARKKIELVSSEMELDSSRKKLLEFKNFKAAASSNKHTTTSNQSIFKFKNEGASSSKEVSRVPSYPRSKICSSFCKGKGVVLQASEAEQLNTRLKILEEENEIMKLALLETAMERKELVNEICHLFQTLQHYSLHHKDEEDGHRSSYGSLILKPSKGGGTESSGVSQLQLENQGSEDPKANILAILDQCYTST
ncbi:uncharacterized protein LOC110427198 isoform X1 [Herrania umbratica]|uniref:Uncharacterized protein LOC110427198 isoform X1 n=1 Tax=Herrania umbratica TaxID=108875 RepID=A0A6J1BFN8_9ROSI|nr:uncharacterized protein LOC110427198 isoform X1 [Herrania umbratica]